MQITREENLASQPIKDISAIIFSADGSETSVPALVVAMYSAPENKLNGSQHSPKASVYIRSFDLARHQCPTYRLGSQTVTVSKRAVQFELSKCKYTIHGFPKKKFSFYSNPTLSEDSPFRTHQGSVSRACLQRIYHRLRSTFPNRTEGNGPTRTILLVWTRSRKAFASIGDPQKYHRGQRKHGSYLSSNCRATRICKFP